MVGHTGLLLDCVLVNLNYRRTEMKELLIVDKLHKTFKLSAKQQKLEHTNSKVKVAVDGISFKAYEGEVFGYSGARKNHVIVGYGGALFANEIIGIPQFLSLHREGRPMGKHAPV